MRFHLKREGRLRDLAMFDLAIDSKLRRCDFVELRVGDLLSAGVVRSRALVTQQKTARPAQFEVMQRTRESGIAWVRARGGRFDEYLFSSRRYED